MASTDATPIPIKNQAYRVTFGIFDADGDLVTGAAGLDSEISKDAGTFADCTNEATEIATSSGMYYLDLTATEMNADTVAVIVKTSTTGAKTTPLVMYPAESTDIPVNVAGMNANTLTASALATDAVTEIQSGLATSAALTTVGGNVSSILANTDVATSTRLASASYTAPDNSTISTINTKLGTPVTSVSTDIAGVQSDTNDIQTRLPAALVSGRIDASVGAMATDTLTAAALAASAVTEIQTGLSTLTAAQVNAEVVDVLTVDTFGEPSSVPDATATIVSMLHWLFTLGRNKRTTTATTDTLRNDADNATIATSTVSDDGTTFTRSEYT